jgi:hypothetical protein
MNEITMDEISPFEDVFFLKSQKHLEEKKNSLKKISHFLS